MSNQSSIHTGFDSLLHVSWSCCSHRLSFLSSWSCLPLPPVIIRSCSGGCPVAVTAFQFPFHGPVAVTPRHFHLLGHGTGPVLSLAPHVVSFSWSCCRHRLSCFFSGLVFSWITYRHVSFLGLFLLTIARHPLSLLVSSPILGDRRVYPACSPSHHPLTLPKVNTRRSAA